MQADSQWLDTWPVATHTDLSRSRVLPPDQGRGRASARGREFRPLRGWPVGLAFEEVKLRTPRPATESGSRSLGTLADGSPGQSVGNGGVWLSGGEVSHTRRGPAGYAEGAWFPRVRRFLQQAHAEFMGTYLKNEADLPTIGARTYWLRNGRGTPTYAVAGTAGWGHPQSQGM